MTHLIGIDCAAQDKKCGLALGVIEADRIRVLEVMTKQARIVPILLPWIRDNAPSLIAIDAPLGWPQPMGAALAAHAAGEAIPHAADDLFHRHTDRVVREHTGKRPMEVGADRIARAALKAVNLLQALRDGSGLALPLAWSPGPTEETSTIEVYPALTLRARGIPDTGYKGTDPAARDRRASILQELEPYVEFGSHADAALASDDALDAVLCLLTARDFLTGYVVEPGDLDVARHEGWIWFRS